MSQSNGARPVRFRVAYRDPEMLINEVARSLGRLGVILESARKVPVGTRFRFELVSEGVTRPVEIEGEVVAVALGQAGRYRLNVRYRPGARGDLDLLVFKHLDRQRADRARCQPRMPVYFPAIEASHGSPSYVVRNLSLGGMRVEVMDGLLPGQVRVGEPVSCEIPTTLGPLSLHGAVAWCFTSPHGVGPEVRDGFGVSFAGELGLEDLTRIDRLLTLKEFFKGKARLAFGTQALRV